jgi:hypothetical protein
MCRTVSSNFLVVDILIPAKYFRLQILPLLKNITLKGYSYEKQDLKNKKSYTVQGISHISHFPY